MWLNYNLTFRNFNVGVENLQPLLQAAAKICRVGNAHPITAAETVFTFLRPFGCFVGIFTNMKTDGTKILVVDDEVGYRKVLNNALT